MKSFITISLFSFVSTIALSQQVVNVDKDEYNAAHYLVSISGEPVVRAKFVRLVDGSPFFVDEWLKSSIITPQGKIYNNAKVKLDLMDNKVHYLDAHGVEFIAITPIKEVILIDSLKNQKFRFISSYSLPMVKGGWYLPLVEGKASLFKAFDKILRENKPYGSAVSEQRIVTKENFILTYNNQVFYLKNIKEVPSVLTDKRAELEAFINAQNKKLSVQDKMVATINYYNSLFTPSSL